MRAMGQVEFNLARGFLPSADPLKSLSNEYQVWEQVSHNLPKLLVAGRIRSTMEEMPIFPIEHLETPAELERAMLLLSFFGHAYVWGENNPATAIPASIAVPWYEVAKKLCRYPVLSYASYALNNWQRIDPNQPVELGNIVLLQNFLGGIDEEWFVLVHVDIEMKAAPALQILMNAQDAVVKNNAELLNQYLEVIAHSLTAMCDTLDRMPQHCDPYIYYNRVRPYIHGWKDNLALPQGLIYEGVSEYRNQPQQFRGETGAQSSIIPSFDALLDVKHQKDPLHLYLMEMREYMPTQHRDFIIQLEKRDIVRNYILKNYNHMTSLRENYNECLQLLSRFRKTHLHYAAQYIHKQSQTSLANPTQVGTGGTPFMTYLRKHKDETLKFIIEK